MRHQLRISTSLIAVALSVGITTSPCEMRAAALSFALDPAVAAPEQALASIERASPTPVKLSLLRVVR